MPKAPDPQPFFGRLCLVTPASVDPDAFPALLDAALGAGDVASLFIAPETTSPAALQRIAELIVPIAQKHGVAAIVPYDTRLLGRSKADGVHVESGPADLREAVEGLRPDRIVGAGHVRTRHEAMSAGELDPDYVFFGRFDGDNAAGIFPKALDLAAWWSAVFEIPAIVMGGREIASVLEAVDARIEFVALRDAVWSDPAGPAAAVAEANRLISERQPEAVR